MSDWDLVIAAVYFAFMNVARKQMCNTALEVFSTFETVVIPAPLAKLARAGQGHRQLRLAYLAASLSAMSY